MILLDAGARPASVSKPPTPWDYFADRAFRVIAQGAVWTIVLLLAYLLWSIGTKAWLGIREHGLGFLTSASWDVSRQQFGILPHIWGTLYSSLLALAIGGFFGVVMAIFLTQDFLPPRLAQVFRVIVELLAAIPSVVYGLWGLFVVIPAMRPVADVLAARLGFIPFFGTTLSGPGLAPAALVLAIMILPTVAAVSQDALRLVPYKVKEMALAMLIGNSNQISLSLFSPANTLAALLALNFPEAGPREVQVLMYAALVLLAITLVVNMTARAIIYRRREFRDSAA